MCLKKKFVGVNISNNRLALSSVSLSKERCRCLLVEKLMGKDFGS